MLISCKGPLGRDPNGDPKAGNPKNIAGMRMEIYFCYIPTLRLQGPKNELDTPNQNYDS